MARPSKNNADYFGHDRDMRNHRKIKAIRAKFGISGYAIWSMLLEVLTGSEDNAISDSEIEMELMAGDFGVSVTEITEVIDYCVRLQLLFSESGQIFSKTLREKLKPVYEKRELARLSYEKRLESKRNSTETGVSDAEMTQSKGKVKGKVNKEEKSNKKEVDADRVGDHNPSPSTSEEEKKDTPSKVPRKVSPPGFEFGLDMPFQTAEFAEAWGDWAKFRIEIRHKLTGSQAKAQLEKLASQPSESIAIAMIRQSIENGWQGLFDLKVQRQQYGQPPPVPEKGKIQQSIENTYEAAQRIRERRLQQQH